MSRENLELALRTYDAFNRRDWDACVGLMDPDLEVESRLTAMEGRYHGYEGAASGTPVADPFWQPMRWVDGRCIWWRNCVTEAEALEAIAAQESRR